MIRRFLDRWSQEWFQPARSQTKPKDGEEFLQRLSLTWRSGRQSERDLQHLALQPDDPPFGWDLFDPLDRLE
jgi:hypothetical protein